MKKPNIKKIDTPLDSAFLISWQGPQDDFIQSKGFGAMSVQVDGDFMGSTCEIKGSNDGVNFYTLFDNHGVPLVFKSPGLKSIHGIVAFIKPFFKDGGENVQVDLLVTGGN